MFDLFNKRVDMHDPFTKLYIFLYDRFIYVETCQAYHVWIETGQKGSIVIGKIG